MEHTQKLGKSTLIWFDLILARYRKPISYSISHAFPRIERGFEWNNMHYRKNWYKSLAWRIESEGRCGLNNARKPVQTLKSRVKLFG